MPIEFGKVEFVHLRDIWAHEADDFTPWLADNLHYVSDAIGIPLELVETEASVDQFWADIVARNPLNDSVALIENQMEWSDHTHLGQILTYLAGREARTVVWVARDFKEAHLSAVRWLNENTAADFSFFAIRVLVAKICDSFLVPQFKVMERPSDWDKRIRGVTRKSGRDMSVQGVFNFNHDFWAHYADRYPDDGLRRGFAGRNPSFPVHGTEFTIIWRHARHKRAGQQVTIPYAMSYQSILEPMEPYLPAPNEALSKKTLGVDGNEIMWGDAFIQLNIDISNPDNWPQAADWLHEKLEIYRRILSREAQE